MNLREERAARNEALFREVNEQVRSLAGRRGIVAVEEIGAVCECSDDQCVERVWLPLTAYERVREHGRQFIVASGHESEFEEVVGQESGYTVVQKQGKAGQIAEEIGRASCRERV